MNFEEYKNTNQKKRFFIICSIGVFLIFSFLIKMPDLQDFFLFQIQKNTSSFDNSMELYYASLKPFRNWDSEPIEIKAYSAISAEVNKKGEIKFLYAKNHKQAVPIASLTKLMVALTALENYDLNQKVVISQKAAYINETVNYFKPGESFYIKDLFYSLLMESSNKSAQAIGEIMGEREFIQLMNEKAKELDLENTRFYNLTGLDPDYENILPNYSTAQDLVMINLHLLRDPFIKQILKTTEFELYTSNGIFHHLVENNNEFLKNSDDIFWEEKIIGGKTGWTPRAGQCLSMVLDNTKNNSFLINIILNSPDRFEEMKLLIDWVYKTYKW